MMAGFFELTGAEVVHVYGATETGPRATMNWLKPALKERMTSQDRWNLRRSQGLPITGVDIKLLGPDDEELPHDGRSVGEICMRGPWITTGYHDMPNATDRFADGYWRSGDAGTINADGYLKLADRLKDVIKSGGEWISSIDMENALISHPAVREAAVVGIPHPKWQERPLALVVLKPGHPVTLQQLQRAPLRNIRQMAVAGRGSLCGKHPENERRQAEQEGHSRRICRALCTERQP